MNITYTDAIDTVTPERVEGFFVGWSNPPTPSTLVEVLKKSHARIIACDGDTVVGFITAITDGVLAAYIPFLEVLPEYQGRGIGTELVRRMLNALTGYYMVDLVCDENMQDFYTKFGLSRSAAMSLRRYENQSGMG